MQSRDHWLLIFNAQRTSPTWRAFTVHSQLTTCRPRAWYPISRIKDATRSLNSHSLPVFLKHFHAEEAVVKGNVTSQLLDENIERI